jgi:hypothetical protein
MKDYTCTFAQFLKFVTFVEGDDIVNNQYIWFNKVRVENFIELMRATNKAPNTIANKAKMFCEVMIYFLFLNNI